MREGERSRALGSVRGGAGVVSQGSSPLGSASLGGLCRTTAGRGVTCRVTGGSRALLSRDPVLTAAPFSYLPYLLPAQHQLGDLYGRFWLGELWFRFPIISARSVLCSSDLFVPFCPPKRHTS